MIKVRCCLQRHVKAGKLKAAAPPDSDGVPEARQQLLHVEISGNLLQDEAHVGV